MCVSDRRRVAAVVLVAILAAASAVAQAQTAPSREQELIRRLRAQVQQLQQAQTGQQTELAQLQARSTALTQQLQERDATLRTLRGERARALDAATRDAEAERATSARLAAGSETLRVQLDDSTRALQALRAEQSRTRQQLTEGSAQASELQRRHVTQGEGLQSCIERNEQLRVLGHELLARYENKGPWEAAQAQEPFLQFQRVALENLVRGYRDKLDAAALRAPAAGAAAASRAEP